MQDQKLLFADDPNELKEILEGNVVADIAQQTKAENQYERKFGQLLEIYTPISFDNGKIVGIVEIYYELSFLSSEILRSQIYSVASITVIFTILFILLYFIVKRASRRILEQDKQLKTDIEKEQEYSSLKDEFITMSSHQLRTPATAIKWSLETLRDKSTGTLNEEQKKLFESIDLSNEALISIVDNLLISSNIKRDYFTLEKEDYSLEQLIQDILKKNEEKIKKKTLTVQLLPGPNLQNIHLRKDAVTHIVDNLLDNAIDYTPSGGQISIRMSQNDNNLRLEVADNGIGIPENEQARVFEKFFRAKNSIEQKNVGSGLGLYICKQIIEGYNGTITFESTEKGTIFRVTLPTTPSTTA